MHTLSVQWHWVVIKWLSFEDEHIEYILLNTTWYIFTEDLLKSVPKRPLNNVLALAQIVVWRRTIITSGEKNTH